jgi:hypothetical protein
MMTTSAGFAGVRRGLRAHRNPVAIFEPTIWMPHAQIPFGVPDASAEQSAQR